MKRLSVLKNLGGCGKKNRLFRVDFMQPAMKTVTSRPLDSYPSETQENLHLSQDNNEGEHVIKGDVNVNIAELIDFLGFEASHLETNMQKATTKTVTNFERVREASTVFQEHGTY